MKDLLDDERIRIAVLAFMAGVILAFIVFPKRELETVYKTTIERLTDTLYITSSDTVYIPKTKIKTEVLRDTILMDFKPKISQFNASFPFEHGSTSVSGEVLGEVLKMTAINDYKLPVVTNTITETKTETIIKKSKGFYLGAAVNSDLKLGANLSYVDNKYLFSYQFQPVTKTHTLGVSKKLF
jgi:hypothetical protein